MDFRIFRDFQDFKGFSGFFSGQSARDFLGMIYPSKESISSVSLREAVIGL